MKKGDKVVIWIDRLKRTYGVGIVTETWPGGYDTAALPGTRRYERDEDAPEMGDKV